MTTQNGGFRPRQLMVVMQLVTRAEWQELMHISQSTAGDTTAIFFLLAVLLGSYFMMNLFVAVMNEKFDVAAAVHDTADAQFDLIDDNGSGDFGKEELRRVFMNNGMYLDQNELDVLFDEIDSMGSATSGVIDRDEFVKWLRGPSPMATKLRVALGDARTRHVKRACGRPGISVHAGFAQPSARPLY